MPCATAKKDGSSRYASSIRARPTRLAGSVRERAIAPNAAKSFSPIANSIACRHAVMSSALSANQSRKPRTHVGKCESSTYDRFHGIDVLDPPITYPPVGRCIYCPDGAGEGDEHIIPYSLNGTQILPRASCHDCERITSYIDGF